jgi:hypothetical protein
MRVRQLLAPAHLLRLQFPGHSSIIPAFGQAEYRNRCMVGWEVV